MTGREDNIRRLEARNAQKRLSKEQLLTPKIIEQDIEIESLGGTVKLKSLSAATRREIQGMSGFGTKDFDEDKLSLLAIQRSLVDPALTEEEVMTLVNQNYAVLDEFNMHIQLINFMGKTDQVKKGSKKTRNSGSASSSPETSA
jgi:hypothetical protein